MTGYFSMLFGVGVVVQMVISLTLFMCRRMLLYAYKGFPVQNIKWLLWLTMCSVVAIGATPAITFCYVWLRVPWALALGVPMLEATLLLSLQYGYVRFVYGPRNEAHHANVDNGVQGDQKTVLSCALIGVLSLCEGFRLAALFCEAELDDHPYTLLLTLSDQLFIETLTRLLLPAWWIALLTKDSTTPWVKQVHQFLLPTPMSKYFNDLKYTVGYCRFPVVLAIWAARSVAIGEAADADDTKVLVIVTALVFVEEVLEDILIVVLGPLSEAWHHRLPVFMRPDWSSIPFYHDLLEHEYHFHPYQLVDNPVLKYQDLPMIPSLCMSWAGVYVQYLLLIDFAGQEWILNLTEHMRFRMNKEDMTQHDWVLYWWPPP